VTGLTNGTEYTFRVAAVNAAGQGAFSATVSATPRTVPGAPTGLTATPGSTQVALSWTAPAATGGASITDYLVEFSADGGSSWSTFADATSTATSATVTGLTNGTEYSFRVAAVNAAGQGAFSAQVSATPRTVPGAPTGLNATPGSTQVVLDWTAPVSNGGASISDYVVEFSVDGTSWSTFDDATSAVMSATVTGLANGTEYSFRVSAVNAAGQGAASATITATPSAVVPVPDAPTGLTATPGSTQVALSWTAPAATGGAAISDYLVEFSVDGGSSWSTFADATSAVTSATVTGLANGTAYTFRVAAVNAAGQGAFSATVSATPRTVPGAPSGLAASPGSTQVALSWTAPVSDGGSAASDYVVQYSADGGSSWSTFADGVSTATSATVTGLANGTAYTFRVAAVNAAGQGAFSATASATPRTVPGAPTGLAATPGSTQVALSWTAPVSDGGSAVSDYVVQYSSNGGSTWSTYVDKVSTATIATVTRLTNGTAYSFRVSAVNAAGTGAASATVSATPRTVPGAPTGLTAAVAPAGGVGSGQVRLSWTAPAATGGASISDYLVQYSSNGGSSWSTFADATSTVTSATVTGLTNGTAYSFRVSALNVAGTGTASVTVSATPRTKPGAPRSVAAVVGPAPGVGSGQVKVSWSAPTSTGGSPITAYVVERSSNGTTWTTVATTGATARSHVAVGLSNGTHYYFRVVARNAVGDTASATVSATPRTRSTAPRFVVAVVAPAPTVGSGQVGIGWLAPASTGGSPITGYVIQRSSNGSAWTTLAVTGATARTYKATGLANGTRYYFRVLARNAVGDSASATVSAVPRTVPSAPRYVTATLGSRQVRLTWAVPSSNGGSAITGYAVQRWTGNRWITITTAAASARSFTATGLANGIRYSFRVIAINGAGFGPPSSTVSAVPR
jgi:titin